METLWQDVRLGFRTLTRAPLFTSGLMLVGIGVALGIAAALSVSHMLANLLFGISSVDPVTFVAVPVLLAGMALAASYVPAFRATRIDPALALRGE